MDRSPRRERLYRASYALIEWPMTVFGWLAPKTGARIATWWMHFCGYALDAHVEAETRWRYRIVRDRQERRPAPPVMRRVDARRPID